MTFPDHFSDHAAGYARHRPDYPEALFRHLASLPGAHGGAWDCGTGNGQAALSLSPFFRVTVATDASAAQVVRARRAPGILYAAAAAENAPLRDSSIDLVTVAQALHWFDFARFFAEASRVARPGAIFAAWAYGECRVTPAVDEVYRRLYRDIVGPYWPPERIHVEAGYRTIPVPFRPLPAPDFAIRAEWDLEAYLAYLDTWSAVQRYRRARGENPLDLIGPSLAAAWEEPGRKRIATLPLALIIGRIKE